MRESERAKEEDEERGAEDNHTTPLRAWERETLSDHTPAPSPVMCGALRSGWCFRAGSLSPGKKKKRNKELC